MQKSSVTIESPKTAARALGPTVCILHVDDNLDDRALFHLACKRAKLPVKSLEVGTVAEAIKYLELFTSPGPLTEPRPDVLVLDLAMPGSSGLAVAEFIRGNPVLKDLPIVVLSGTLSPSLQNQATQLGANWIVEKPASFDVLIRIVSEIIRRSCPSPPETQPAKEPNEQRSAGPHCQS